MDKFFQCCYTNDASDAGGGISSGWRTVAVSSDIPQDALETCAKLQDANSLISPDPARMVDEFGSVLNLEEIFGDGNYIYVIRTKYGMSDRLGRANMFSHAFILPCRDVESVMDPNAFLTIAEENFKDNKRDAEKLCNVPGIPISNGEYSIGEALSSCQMGESEYRTLLSSVYVHIAEKKIPEPLFVEYNGTCKNRRELLYCIYFGIPLSVRRCLSSVSCPNGNIDGKTIVFTVNAKNKEHYIIPQTGENNVLSPRLTKRLSRYGFVDYAACHYKDGGFEDYFTSLEEKAIRLGDEKAYDKLFLKIAHILITEQGASALQEVSDDELDLRLSDALRTGALENPMMDRYISGLWDEFRKRGIALTSEMKALLPGHILYAAEPLLDNMENAYKNHEKTAEWNCMESEEGDGDTWEKIERDLSTYQKEIAKRAGALYKKELSVVYGRKAVEAYMHYISIVEQAFGNDIKKYITDANELIIKKFS